MAVLGNIMSLFSRSHAIFPYEANVCMLTAVRIIYFIIEVYCLVLYKSDEIKTK
jgi:hypothetical protein